MSTRLYVAKGGLEKAYVTNTWGFFAKIEEKSFSGIEDVIADADNGEIDFSAPAEVYNLQGQKLADSVEGLASGTYIARQGKTVKKIAIR